MEDDEEEGISFMIGFGVDRELASLSCLEGGLSFRYVLLVAFMSGEFVVAHAGVKIKWIE